MCSGSIKKFAIRHKKGIKIMRTETEFNHKEQLSEEKLEYAINQISKIINGEINNVEFSIPAKWEYVKRIRNALFSYDKNDNKKHFFKSDKFFDYEMCFGELLNNALEHGCNLGNPEKMNSQLSKEVNIKINKINKKLIIEIGAGEGFDYRKYEQKAKKYKNKRLEEIEKFGNIENLSDISKYRRRKRACVAIFCQ